MIYNPDVTSDKKIKVRIYKDDITDTYDISRDNSAVPLTRGAGLYKIEVYENISGNKYKLLKKDSVDVPDYKATYFTLLENAHVRFTERVKEIAKEIYDSVNDKTDRALALAAYDWVYKNIAYDFIKAIKIKLEEIPDLDSIIDKKIGICIDKACLYAAICRFLGVKCKVCIGKIKDARGSTEHAWNRVFVDGKWKRVDPTTNQYRTKTHIVERYY